MHDGEHETDPSSIDNHGTSSAYEGGSDSTTAPSVQVHVHPDRTRLISGENWTSPLIASGIIALVMAISFLAGVDSIFPVPPPPSSSTSVEAPSAESSPATSADQATMPVPATAPPNPETTPPAKESPSPKAETPPPGTSGDSRDPSPAPDAKGETTDPKASSATQAPDASNAPPAASSGGKTSYLEDTRLRGPEETRLLLARVSILEASGGGGTGDRPGFFGRLVLFVKFLFLVCLGTVLAVVALGGIALMSDRPLGDFKAAAARVSLCCWISTLALFVPSPEPWLRDPIHYASAALLFWISGMLLLRLSPRHSATLLAGTVALLAVTAIGSRVVVWATW
ncbi:MAG: hypothetical protein VX563_03165 [Planctomycetota bacterium]|nr:hypothetical protein [Planctomycetota bacterium]